MKFIMTKCIRSVCIHVNVEHKTHVNVKLCKYIFKLCKTMSKHVTFIWGEGEWKRENFQNVFGDGPIKVAHYHTKKTLKTFVLVDAPKPIKLINMNNNKYPSSCKSLGQK